MNKKVAKNRENQLIIRRVKPFKTNKNLRIDSCINLISFINVEPNRTYFIAPWI